MDNESFFLKLRAISIWGDSFCRDKKCYGSEEKALSDKKAEEDVSAWPCPFCSGDPLVIDGHELSLKGPGWHLGPNSNKEELETITMMSAKECVEHGYPQSNKNLIRHLDIFSEECIFENYGAKDIADPEISKIYEIAEKAYFLFKDAVTKKV